MAAGDERFPYHHYKRLVEQSKDTDSFDEETPSARVESASKYLIWQIIALASLLTTILMGGAVWSERRSASTWREQPSAKFLYSPADSSVAYKNITFTNGFNNDQTIFMKEPSQEVDDAWDSLYLFALSRVPKSEAALMANRTAPLKDDDGYYLVELDIFHQLHCLNMIRKALHPHVYGPTKQAPNGEDELFGISHLMHCVDSLRQSLMCSSDITPLVWQWKEKDQRYKIKSNVIHTCRDFDQIKSWALERQLKTSLDLQTRIEDDLEFPEF